MKSSVVIKGCKSGMTVILNPDTPFEQLLEDVGKKFKESEKFWGSAQMTLTLEGRELTPIEELQVTDAITANSQIEILCLLDTDANRIARCEKALTERLMELTARTGQFYKGNLSPGRSAGIRCEHRDHRGCGARRACQRTGQYRRSWHAGGFRPCWGGGK